MALTLRRAEERFIPQSTRAVSSKRLLGGPAKRSLQKDTSSARQACAHDFNNLPAGWQYTDGGKLATVYNNLAIDQDLKLPELTAHHDNLGLELATNTRRHPDGMNTRDSVDTISESDASH